MSQESSLSICPLEKQKSTVSAFPIHSSVFQVSPTNPCLVKQVPTISIKFGATFFRQVSQWVSSFLLQLLIQYCMAPPYTPHGRWWGALLHLFKLHGFYPCGQHRPHDRILRGADVAPSSLQAAQQNHFWLTAPSSQLPPPSLSPWLTFMAPSATAHMGPISVQISWQTKSPSLSDCPCFKC